MNSTQPEVNDGICGTPASATITGGEQRHPVQDCFVEEGCRPIRPSVLSTRR